MAADVFGNRRNQGEKVRGKKYKRQATFKQPKRQRIKKFVSRYKMLESVSIIEELGDKHGRNSHEAKVSRSAC